MLLVSALGLVLTAVLTWVGRAVVRYLAALLKIKLDQSALMKVDWAAQQASLAAEQYFRRVVTEKGQEAARSAEKLAYAKRQATSLAPEAVARLGGEEQLEAVIEAHVAQIPTSTMAVVPATRRITSMLPPPMAPP